MGTCICMAMSVSCPPETITKFLSAMHASVLSHFSHVLFFAILWTAARQASLFMDFSRQEY